MIPHFMAQRGGPSGAGADKLKAALSARHMKCGGTPEQRAERLFKCRGRQLHELPANLFIKGAAPAAVLDEAARSKRIQAAKHTANIEAKILAVVDSLGAVVEDTQAWVEKKLAQNYDELKQDIEREDFDVGPEDSDEEVQFLGQPLSALAIGTQVTVPVPVPGFNLSKQWSTGMLWYGISCVGSHQHSHIHSSYKISNRL